MTNLQTRWLYIMGLEESVLLISQDVFNIIISKKHHISWYKRHKDFSRFRGSRL